ncbi:hypothetical protein [Saccharothrix coeruleofusca]|uniref:Uncharacterized protein n=1 Tax=Saccharothrix coeruleofusca TaxID=33919 RepID=A0A918AL01_9PSEU|nr:hypothetical protein [Saccharothrix coeruleofusca]MBP2338125.1 hypothetical protein [Saccharothrix coeruleofusca]GGP50596.1 hypothetical protein GCM10010185_23600 [Saccharothrix coeruleofusca]
MTSPAPISPEQQGAYARRIADQLLQTLPPGWEYAQVHFREIGHHGEVNAMVQNVAGGMEQWSPPAAVAERFHELREAMLGGDNAWYSARFEVWFTGEQKLRMNRSEEPRWISPPPPEAYQEELRLSGGSAQVLPDWLRAKLG